jgi:mono/diheme cytochrome c family protein
MSADMPGKGKSCGLAFAAILLTGLAMQPALADGNTAPEGSTLATEYCSACHRVTLEQPLPPPVVMQESTSKEAIQAPSFRQIARRPGRSADYLRAFIQAPHYPMPEQQFIPEELDAIIAYITSLKTSGGDW